MKDLKNTKALLLALAQGKKINNEDWAINEYCFIDEQGFLIDEQGEQQAWDIFDRDQGTWFEVIE